MSASLLKQRFDCALRVSGSLVLQADQDLLLPCAKTADVTRQPGQSGSSSPRAPDRPAEPHDGWALSISWLHLWPVPDYSWRLLYSLLSSALHAPLTPHSERAAGIKPSQQQRENHSWSWEVGEEKWGAEEDFFPPTSPLSYFQCSNDTVKRCCFFDLLQPSLCHHHYTNLQHLLT